MHLAKLPSFPKLLVAAWAVLLTFALLPKAASAQPSVDEKADALKSTAESVQGDSNPLAGEWRLEWVISDRRALAGEEMWSEFGDGSGAPTPIFRTETTRP